MINVHYCYYYVQNLRLRRRYFSPPMFFFDVTCVYNVNVSFDGVIYIYINARTCMYAHVRAPAPTLSLSLTHTHTHTHTHTVTHTHTHTHTPARVHTPGQSEASH